MQKHKVLITICRQEIAPRFDMTSEVLITSVTENITNLEECKLKHLILAHTSSKELCDIIISQDIAKVVCGGIEEDYFHYLRWKRIEVINNVMGQTDDVIKKLLLGELQAGNCLFERRLLNEQQFTLS